MNVLFDISDARGHVWAFTVRWRWFVNWRQNKLEARIITGPALTPQYVVVGDAQGFLHWLSKEDGHFAARVKVSGAIYASPISDANRIYALTSKGCLFAYMTG